MDELARGFERALELGFRAIKMEAFFGDLVSDRELVGCIQEGRRLVGDDTTLLVDFGYRWSDWRAALWTLNRLEDCDLYLAEATLQHDDLDGHAKLAERAETRIGGAEMAATRFECREWIEHGRVDVLQPDVNRAGGLTEMARIAQLAELAGVLVVPHGWKTGITAAAARHLQAAMPNVPFVEHLSPDLFDSPLRRELVSPEPTVVDGAIELPTAPGLGIELDAEAVERYRTGHGQPELVAGRLARPELQRLAVLDRGGEAERMRHGGRLDREELRLPAPRPSVLAGLVPEPEVPQPARVPRELDGRPGLRVADAARGLPEGRRPRAGGCADGRAASDRRAPASRRGAARPASAARRAAGAAARPPR